MKRIKLIPILFLIVLVFSSCGLKAMKYRTISGAMSFAVSSIRDDTDRIIFENGSIDEVIGVTGYTLSLMDQVTDDDNKRDLQPGYFEEEIARLSKRTTLTFPNVQVNNELNHTEYDMSYGTSAVYSLTPEEDYDKVIFYIHGGAGIYNINSLHVKLVDRLVSETGAKAYMPLYPLAPQWTYKEIYQCLETAYLDVLEPGKEIIVMGDSAGGTLALGFTEYIKKKNYTMPDKLVLISACVDSKLDNPDIDEYEDRDILLAKYGCVEAAKMLSEGAVEDDYRARPLYGDLTALPQTLIIIGTEDIMYPDNMLLYNRLKDNGTGVKLVTGKGLFHIFTLIDIPEGEKSIRIISRFVGLKK